jgi:type I restriction enzyme S subunit
MAPGDVVYGRRGDIGRRAFIGPRETGWLCGTGCLRLRPNPTKVAPRFFFDALGHPTVVGTIIARAQGATMPNLNTGLVASVSMVIPPRALQEDYADQVEDRERLLEKLGLQNEKLVQARDLLLPRLMDGRLTV